MSPTNTDFQVSGQAGNQGGPPANVLNSGLQPGISEANLGFGLQPNLSSADNVSQDLQDLQKYLQNFKM